MAHSFDIERKIAEFEEEVAQEMLKIEEVSGPRKTESACKFRGGQLPQVDGNWEKTKEDVNKLLEDAKQDAVRCLDEAKTQARDVIDKTAEEAKRLIDEAKEATKK